MNVFTPQVALPQQIPISQCLATPKKSLSCTLAVVLGQVSPRYADIPDPSWIYLTPRSAAIQSYETTPFVRSISRMWNGAGVQLGYSLGCGYTAGDIPGVKRLEREIGY